MKNNVETIMNVPVEGIEERIDREVALKKDNLLFGSCLMVIFVTFLVLTFFYK